MSLLSESRMAPVELEADGAVALNATAPSAPHASSLPAVDMDVVMVAPT